MTSKRLSGLTFLVMVGLLLAATIGCNKGAGWAPSNEPHGHHGGHAVELSGDAGIQMELTLDDERRWMVIYVQESGTHTPHALPVETLQGKFETDRQVFDVIFSPDPRVSDPPGSSSRFVLSLDKLPQQLLASNQFLLRLSYSDNGVEIEVAIYHSNDHTHDYDHD